MALFRGTGGSGDASTDTYASEVALEATRASTKANEAAASATSAANAQAAAETAQAAAETAKTNAETAETNAETAETNAETAENAAVAAKVSAETAKTAADTAQSAAEVAKTAAETAETNAETAETNAAASATTATTKAGEAATSATNAASSASSASTSATNAATSATAAQTAQTAAEAAKTAAEAAQDAIDGLYLGAQSSNPTVDLNGNAVTTGDWYFNTGDNSTRIYTGSAWNTINPDLVGDTSPQLGGNLDLNSRDITGTGNVNITGNVVLSGTVDGRDVAADGTKLDGVEASATADQTAAEIRTLVESASDSNVFTDADHSKLNAIEAGATADQTATEIKTLVGSASDSNVFTDADHSKLDGIEASATADQTAAEIRTLVESASDSNVFTDADHTKLNAIEASATADQTDAEIRAAVEAATDSNVFTDADHTKLNAIEASADVTDTANVTAAGALMDSELTAIASVKALNQGVATTDSPTFAALTSTGEITANGGIALGDGDELTLGDSDEFKIKHHASGYTHLQNTVGTLYIDSDSVTFRDDDGSPSNMVISQTGIDVTGTVTADGLTVDTGSTFAVSATLGHTGGSQLLFLSDDGGSRNQIDSQKNSASADLDLATGGTKRQRIGSNGDISFYEDTGSTAKLTWSASNESLTFGTNLAITTNEIDVATGDLTLDVAGVINLDADGAEVAFKDGGTHIGSIINNDSNFVFRSIVQDKDVLIRGNDGGSAITALTLDMSAAGAATFNSTVTSTAFGSQLATTLFEQNVLKSSVTASSGAFVRMAVSSASNPTYAFEDDTDTGVFTSGANTLNFGTAGAERLRIGSGGDISFYEDTGTTAKFFWDASAERLGLGTTSPSGALHVFNSSAGEQFISSSNSAMRFVSTGGANYIQSGTATSSSSAADLIFTNVGGSGETMRIDSSGRLLVGLTGASGFGTVETDTLTTTGQCILARTGGNVGIGTSSLTGGNTILNLSRTGSGVGCNMQFANSHNSAFYVGIAGNTSGDAILHSADGTAGMAFGTGNTERMRILSGGNITIGTVDAYFYSNASSGGTTIDAGFKLESSTQALEFWTADAERMRIDSSGHLIVPNGVTLGTAVGTYAAANTLDDYEEGTFTPTVAGTTTAGSASYSIQQARYTKIGRLVYYSIRIGYSSHTGAGNMIINGLPFTSDSLYSAGEYSYRDGLTVPSNEDLKVYVPPNVSYVGLYAVALGTNAVAALALDTAVTDLSVNGVYHV